MQINLDKDILMQDVIKTGSDYDNQDNERFYLLLVCVINEIQNVNNSGTYYIFEDIGFLLLPNYFVNQLLEPLSNAT